MKIAPACTVQSIRRTGGCFIFLTCLLSAAAAVAQDSQGVPSDPVKWRTGTDFQNHLRSVTSVEWHDAELRPRLAHLTATHRIAVFLDRRIDPDQKLEFSQSGAALEYLLDDVAQSVGARTARLGPLIYIGPPRTCGLLTVIAPQRRKEVHRHAALARARPQPWKWNELAEPRQLLLELAQRHQLTIENPEVVPHDLWPAADLPPLELADQLTLLLSGFDLTFEITSDSRNLRLAPLPADAQYELAYAPAGDVAKAATAIQRDFPEVSVRRDGSRLIVRAAARDHDRIAERFAGPRVRSGGKPSSEVTYTLTVRNQPAGAVLDLVAKRLGKKLSFAAGLQEKLSQKMNLEVKEVSLEVLLAKVLQPLGLSYRVSEEALEIVEK